MRYNRRDVFPLNDQHDESSEIQVIRKNAGCSNENYGKTVRVTSVESGSFAGQESPLDPMSSEAAINEHYAV